MYYILVLIYLNIFASAFFTGENRCPSYLDALSPLNAQHLLSLPPQTFRNFRRKTNVRCTLKVDHLQFGEIGVCTAASDKRPFGLITCELDVASVVVLYRCGMTDDAGQENGRRGDNVQAIVQLKYEANNTLILLPNVKIGRRTQRRTGAQVQFENIDEEFEQDSVLSYVFSERSSHSCKLSDGVNCGFGSCVSRLERIV
ncbi:hypothetical protein SprV_0301083900 [Sparganum proliferum]